MGKTKDTDRVATTAERPLLVISLTAGAAAVIARYPHGEVVQAAGFFRECVTYWHPEEGKPDETAAVLFWPDANLSAKQRALALCTALAATKGEAEAGARKEVMAVLRGFTYDEHRPRMDIEGIPAMQEGDEDYGEI